jgi:pectinesterase
MTRHTYFFVILVVLIPASFGLSAVTETKVPAFPGAEGYGRFATGGRGGEVLAVTNLNDSGPGSLRAAIEHPGPRIVVFGVSGTIILKSRLNIRNNDITIAGQSAPGDGICIRDYPVNIDADNVIIRFMRFRLGDVARQEADALGGRSRRNIIIDHCSASWSVDECVSFYENQDLTIQWCLIAESLNDSVHHKGPHGYGAIWGGQRVTFHHNLFAHHKSRNPRFSGSSDATADDVNHQLDFYNNVIYNWGANSVYGGENGEHNMINNFYKPGPATPRAKSGRIVNPSEPYGRFYVTGNKFPGNSSINQDNWAGGVQCDDPNSAYAGEPFPTDAVIAQSGFTAYELVLSSAGASLHRDAVDKRIIGEVRAGTATYRGSRTSKPGIIDSQADVGGWPELISPAAPTDSDGDGMPDDWEQQHGLDPDNSADATGKTLDENYDNIEVYLNSLVAGITETQQGQSYDFVVAADGLGDFHTVQAAIDAVADFSEERTHIFIRAGTYKEKITLPDSGNNITLIGEDADTTILTYDDYASKRDALGNEIGTSGSASFVLNGNGVTAEEITFENSSGPVGQAVAMRIDGDRVVFRNCRFLGFQDTLYPRAANSRQYYTDCLIEGTVDFIFGASTAVFEDCTILCKNGGYITAASTQQQTSYGFVFLHCDIISEAPQTSFYLGRPWRDYARVVFMECYLGPHIKPEGWHNWGQPQREKTAFFAEYKNTGRGAGIANRVPWSHQLTDEQAREYTLDNIFAGWDPATQ